MIRARQTSFISLFLLLLACVLSTAQAQTPLSRDEALKQLYHEYDATNATAQWICTKDQIQSLKRAGWLCRDEDVTVTISVLLMAEVDDGNEIYLVASAEPAKDPSGYGCHTCAPAIGVAIFAWKADRWIMQSANTATGFYGGWGHPPDVDFVTIGPYKHGLMLSLDDDGGGFTSSSKALLAPIDKTVREIWSIPVEEDDYGAYDPTDSYAEHVRYRSSVGINFIANDESINEDTYKNSYYDIEAISRGKKLTARNRLKDENWTDIYRFSNSKYRRVQHHVFSEIRRSTKSH